MTKEDLVRRSPMRLFEQSIQGGLKPGEIGILASPRGIGKTAVLVQIALDKLLGGKKVIHVSFARQMQDVFAWYDDILEELAGGNLESANETKNEITQNRVLMNFNQNGTERGVILKSLRAMIADGGFAADTLVIDGFDFSSADRSYISDIKAFAVDMKLSIWCNCSVNGDGQGYDDCKIPLSLKDFAGLIDVVVVLEPKADHVELSVSKDRENLPANETIARLDTNTLLLLEK